MQDVSVSLGGYRGVRAELLVALKKAQPVTARELGARFGLTANALRRYLKVLEEEGLVCFRRTVRGLGAPVYAFSLTETGEALFPRTYASVVVNALTALRTELGASAVGNVLSAEWAALAADAEPLMASLPMPERVSVLAELLTSRGYMAEAVTDETDDGREVTTLRLHNCSMREIAEKFPEACVAEAEFVERVLGVPVVRQAHQLRGCRSCEYLTQATPRLPGDAAPDGESVVKLAEEQA